MTTALVSLVCDNMNSMNKYKNFSLVFAFLIVFALFVTSHAHGHGLGSSIEKSIEGKLIDIGYDPEDVQAGKTVIYDFALLDGATNEPVEYTDIWVRIYEGRKTYLATGIARANLGKTTLSYVYPEEGEYVMSVRFKNEDEKLVEADFDLPVAESEDASSSNSNYLIPVLGLVVGLILGLAGALFFKKGKYSE